MGKRGPQPRASGVIVPGEREPPPSELTPNQKRIWQEVAGRLPFDWFTAENRPLLKELCRHINYSDRLAREIEEVEQELVELAAGSLEETEKREKISARKGALHSLLRLHGYQTERCANLSTKLRLTVQSRYQPNKAADKVATGPTTKPWEWGAADDDGEVRQ